MSFQTQRQRLVIMAKAPEAGRVKTRLARDIGTSAATRFYRHVLSDTVRHLRDDRRWRLELAVSPDRAVASSVWPTRILATPQGGGDLGDRMARVLAAPANGATVIVGSDIPGITKTEIAAAFQALRGHDAVVGPAPDGGYWLIGMRREAVCRGLFADVRWSTPHTLSDTLATMPNLRVARLQARRDVDTIDDFKSWQRGKLNI